MIAPNPKIARGAADSMKIVVTPRKDDFSSELKCNVACGDEKRDEDRMCARISRIEMRIEMRRLSTMDKEKSAVFKVAS